MMRDHLVQRLLKVIDLRDWDQLGTLVTDDVRYDRPGYPTIHGVAQLLDFYRHTRVIADGRHKLESLLTDQTQGFCWGSFEGISRSGEPLFELFADWYVFEADRICRRRSFFYKPAI
ncbi:nuclear transport factor 2 family protein [Kibdelosporangium aridum]|uniref:SnoaL-like domain-containing protein n=1 Tax=Kibdelosporangium aridum TaxID=2030 RepID=A0A1W2BB09_KIBAR|nr:nuclear transport factor 2 family protein [Kibdelosporangium aridum]SMC69558.1 SnoaL-like domain-containing protein [Kibdelosporangium aridum]